MIHSPMYMMFFYSRLPTKAPSNTYVAVNTSRTLTQAHVYTALPHHTLAWTVSATPNSTPSLHPWTFGLSQTWSGQISEALP